MKKYKNQLEWQGTAENGKGIVSEINPDVIPADFKPESQARKRVYNSHLKQWRKNSPELKMRVRVIPNDKKRSEDLKSVNT